MKIAERKLRPHLSAFLVMLLAVCLRGMASGVVAIRKWFDRQMRELRWWLVDAADALEVGIYHFDRTRRRRRSKQQVVEQSAEVTVMSRLA